MHRQHPTQHPLRGTVLFNPGDTSIDTSYTNVQDEADLSEPREVQAIFGAIGRDVQGPAGSPVPENEGDEPEYMEFQDMGDVEYRYSDNPEAPEDAIGPVPLIGHIGSSFSLEELTRNDQAAVAATVAAQFHGCKSTVAEAAAEANHPPSLALAPGGQGSNHSPNKQENASTLVVNDALRRKVVQRIAAGLASNPRFLGEATAAAAAADCEEAVFGSSRSLIVYQSIAANAVRVAREAGGLAEVLRVAKGQPLQQDAAEQPKLAMSPDPMNYTSSEHGTIPQAILKMDYT